MSIKRIHINNKQYGVIKESEWNLHYQSSNDEHNLKPYGSDNKYAMISRDTGHFGSGTYFSTFDKSNDSRYLLKNSLENNNDPHFIRIGDSVYRVDFDLYKNLYRVRTKKQGDILFTMMKNLNNMYNKICHDLGNFGNGKRANYNNATNYQIIKKNADALNLKCPSYYELTRMAQEHGKNKDDRRSFSTVFMEMNGYNGVNVSGVEYYDNTLHGSVIYDLSKINTTMQEVNPKSLFTGFDEKMYNNTIAADGYLDNIQSSLNDNNSLWARELNEMPTPQAMRLLKNYLENKNILEPFYLRRLNETLLKRYLKLIYTKGQTDYYVEQLCKSILDGGYYRDYLKAIEDTKSYYWANYYNKKVSGLIALLKNYDADFDLSPEEEMEDRKQYLNTLKSYMNRNLEPSEIKYIEEDFLYDWNAYYDSLKINNENDNY